MLVTKQPCDYKTDTVADLMEWLSRLPADTPILDANVTVWTADHIARNCRMGNTDAWLEQNALARAELEALRRRCLDKGYIEEVDK